MMIIIAIITTPSSCISIIIFAICLPTDFSVQCHGLDQRWAPGRWHLGCDVSPSQYMQTHIHIKVTETLVHHTACFWSLQTWRPIPDCTSVATVLPTDNLFGIVSSLNFFCINSNVQLYYFRFLVIDNGQTQSLHFPKGPIP